MENTKQITAANEIAKMINDRNFAGATGKVWAKGDVVRVYVSVDRGGRCDHHIAVDADGIASASNSSGKRGIADMVADVVAKHNSK